MILPEENDLVKVTTIYGDELMAFYRDSCFLDIKLNTVYIEEEIKSWEIRFNGKG